MNQTSKSAKRGLLTTCAIALALVATTSASGAGFAIYETSSRGLAMGNANVGRIDDASALYSNPAAITQLPGVQVLAGAAIISPSVKVATTYNGSSNDTSMDDYSQIVPHLYATYRITDDIAVGLGVFVPFGLKSDFSSNPTVWPGAYNNYMTEIKTVEIAPTFAYRLVHDQAWAKQISIAAGISILKVDVDIRRLLNPTTSLILKGDTWEYGYNLAAQWEVNDQLGFGVVYRSGFSVGVNGASAQIGSQSYKASGQMDLPDSWTFGVNYSPVSPLNIGVQAVWTGWSSYDYLNIQIPTAPIPQLQNVSSPKHWSNVWRYSIGAEYQLNNAIALRAGFVLDKDPVNKDWAEFMVPSNDRQIYSIGLGWTISKTVTLDFAYAYLKIKGSQYSANAINHINIPGLTQASIHGGYATILSVSGNFRF